MSYKTNAHCIWEAQGQEDQAQLLRFAEQKNGEQINIYVANVEANTNHKAALVDCTNVF